MENSRKKNNKMFQYDKKFDSCKKVKNNIKNTC